MNRKQSARKLFALFLSLSFIFVSALSCGFAKQTKSEPIAKNTNQSLPENNPSSESDNKDAAALFNANLIKDGDAESENHKAWKPSDILKTIVYGEFGGGPAKDSPGPANRGEKYFYANVTTENPLAVVSQKIAVGAAAKTVDEGKAQYTFGGWFGGVNTSFSSARLILVFTDKDGKQIGTITTDEVKPEDRADDLVLIERKQSGVLPSGTRSIEIKLEFYILKGHESETIETNAYADNLSLILKGAN